LPGSDEPAVGAEVTLVGPEGGETVVRTDDAGQFRSEPLPTGKYRVQVEADGSGTAALQTYVVAGQTTKTEVQLTGGNDEAIEVTVRGESEGEQLERSARAVEVIDTEEAAQRSQDMGEVVSSEEGADVRRTGGLGSGSRFSLNGLNDNQVRFFLDGVPLEYAGFPFGMANVPVNLVERVDIYSGVVPVRFGADALGGAVDLVTPSAPADDGMRASYQVGSFDTHRLTLSGRTVDEENGWYARANGFFDYSANDYPVDVEVADASGQTSDATVRRFHDTYRAAGGGVEVGVTNREWADELSVRGFVSDYSKDLQHNLVMSVPYGSVAGGETVGGGVVRYKHDLESPLSLDLAAGYNHSRGWLDDTAECRYDWFGRCVSDRERRGELGEFPSDHRIWENAGFARLNGTWQLADAHELRLTVAPTYVTRTGADRIEQAGGGRDPIEADRDLMDLVTGVEYQANLFDGRLENIAFAKDYLQIATTNETLPTGEPVNNDRTTHRVGFGDSLRYQFTEWLRGKASYEWATRLPSAEEMFGNGIRIQPNSALEPERSHNANLELSVDGLAGTTGSWRGSATGFLRRSNQLVVLLGGANSFSYQNVYDARSTGFEAAVGWTAPGEWLALDANATYVDLRNVSEQGAFDEFQGDRIPNRPYLFGHTQARLQEKNVFAPGDVLSATWQSRYVHEYYRGWESLGRTEFKQVIPAQWRQSVALGYEVENDLGALSTTVEVQNLTDQKVFDFFGVQRPGRAFYLKTTLEL
jgi:outer membrane receptor protein involved in Fe transport